jgi:hypothetical protein
MMIPKKILLLFAALMLHAAASARTHGPQEVLVVYNANSYISSTIAKDYAARRSVHQLLAIHCEDSATKTENETISLEHYTLQIEQPIATYLARHPKINFIVLTKGVPIRVRGAKTGSRDEITRQRL